MNCKSILFISLTLISLIGHIQANQENKQGQNYYTGGGCAMIPGIGSPILMVPDVHKYIQDALHMKNQYTQIKYIYYSKTASDTMPGQNLYKLVFSITDYYSTKYLAMALTISPFGIGSVQINKVLLTKDINLIKTIFDQNVDATKSYSCGDLKLVYNSYGTGSKGQIDSKYPGFNYNHANIDILNMLNQKTATPKDSKTCVSVNYIETNAFYGTTSSSLPFDLVNCIPKKQPVAAIMVGCQAGATASLQMVYNNIDNNGTKMSLFVGNPSIPASSVTTIPLGAADRIIFTSHGTPNTFKIETLDENNAVLNSYQCGVCTSCAGSPKTVAVRAYDFLGFSSIYTNGSIIQAFQIAQYHE